MLVFRFYNVLRERSVGKLFRRKFRLRRFFVRFFLGKVFIICIDLDIILWSLRFALVRVVFVFCISVII